MPTTSSMLVPYTTLFRSRDVGDYFNPVRETHFRHLAERRVRLLRRAGHHLQADATAKRAILQRRRLARSEEHTSELQSRRDLVCRLLLEKKNITKSNISL